MRLLRLIHEEMIKEASNVEPDNEQSTPETRTEKEHIEEKETGRKVENQ